jgi:2,5-diamino-6-(ribosylamino)-4(3H)-pyrimidinone 5'-phosphate reductase
MNLHYQIVGKYRPQLYLVGSNTVKTGIDMFGDVPTENEQDFIRPKKNVDLAYWVIPDTKGALKGLLHYCRRSEFCKDVIVLVSKQTPQSYLNYLRERNYDHYVVGENQVNLPQALQLLSEKYATTNILADTGRILSNALLMQGLVSELSLLIHPVIVGDKAYNMFGNINQLTPMHLQMKKSFAHGYIWLTYKVTKT